MSLLLMYMSHVSYSDGYESCLVYTVTPHAILFLAKRTSPSKFQNFEGKKMPHLMEFMEMFLNQTLICTKLGNIVFVEQDNQIPEIWYKSNTNFARKTFLHGRSAGHFSLSALSCVWPHTTFAHGTERTSSKIGMYG